MSSITLYHGCWICQGMVGLAPKWVRLDPKFDKSGTFSDQISVHLAREPNVLKSDLKKSRIFPIWGPI